jgi:hypothetical protein
LRTIRRLSKRRRLPIESPFRPFDDRTGRTRSDAGWVKRASVARPASGSVRPTSAGRPIAGPTAASKLQRPRTSLGRTGSGPRCATQAIKQGGARFNRKSCRYRSNPHGGVSEPQLCLGRLTCLSRAKCILHFCPVDCFVPRGVGQHHLWHITPRVAAERRIENLHAQS